MGARETTVMPTASAIACILQERSSSDPSSRQFFDIDQAALKGAGPRFVLVHLTLSFKPAPDFDDVQISSTLRCQPASARLAKHRPQIKMRFLAQLLSSDFF